MRFIGDERSLNHDATERMPRQLLQPWQRDVLAGRYEVTSRIGRGRTTEVFVAYDHQLERVVAIKQARDDVPGETVTSERLRKEALALATIESPHVAAIYDIGCGDRGVFLVMQRLNGRTIDEEVESNGPVDPARGCRLVHDVLSGLSMLHASGLVHGDLKASNVLLDRHGRAVLIDLGAAMLPRAQLQIPAG
ncbi:MAG: protein kinase, partial [Myxococcales bacterium]|nr:protein kinase [Myxococcales bacterium]